jgi:LAO/AO transport system kinase
MTKANGWFSLARRDQTRKWMHEIIQQGLRQRFESHPAIRKRMEELEQEVLEGRTTSFRAALTLLEMYSGGK